jgi:hypothetical protein
VPRRSTGEYPADWKHIANAVKSQAGWTCIRCAHPHDVLTGHTLTVHHADMNPSNNRWWNLLALCQRCHLSVQGRVIMERPWVFGEHSAWFKPYVAGYYAHKYLGLSINREEAEADLDYYLRLERDAVLGPRLIDQEEMK